MNSPAKTVEEDGFDWIPQGGELWGTKKTCAAYRGMALTSWPAYASRHNEIRRKRWGRFVIYSKSDIDRESIFGGDRQA